MLERIYLPSQPKPVFSTAHDQAVIGKTLDAVKDAWQEMLIPAESR
jgi:hypothetical protein